MKTLPAGVVTLLAVGCMHRAPALPAPIPPVSGDPRIAFALHYIDVAAGTGAAVAPRKCLYALHRVAHERHQVRFFARHHPRRQAATTDQFSSGSAPGDRRLGPRLRGDACRRPATSTHPVSTRLRRARTAAGNSAQVRIGLRRRAHGGRRHPPSHATASGWSTGAGTAMSSLGGRQLGTMI